MNFFGFNKIKYYRYRILIINYLLIEEKILVIVFFEF